MKSVVSGPLAGLRIPTFAVNDSDEQLDHSGFTRVPRAKAAKAFPRPRQATLGDFITNRFKAISVVDDPDDQVSYDGRPLRKRYEATEPAACAAPPRSHKTSLRTVPGLHGKASTANGGKSDPCGSREGLRPPADEPAKAKPIEVSKGTSVEAVSPSDAIRQSLRDVEAILREEFDDGGDCRTTAGAEDGKQVRFNLIDEPSDENDEVLAQVQPKAIRVAIDSGAVRSVAHPAAMPTGIKITPNPDGKHFSGAGGEPIERFGECETLLTGSDSQINGRWSLADVSRPLHSVSQITGPRDGDGNQDVLFNNKICVVVPPGVVEAVMRQIKPVARYHREGGLYIADFTLSDFVRQVPAE